jgi:nicotinamidase-related amidase
MMSAFNEYAKVLWAKGYSVLPIAPKSKRVILDNWSFYCKTQTPTSVLKPYLKQSDLNIGVALGEASGVIALDFDYDHEGLHAKLEGLLPPSIVAKRGSKGYTAFFRFNNEVSRQWKAGGNVVVELLSTGRQTVLPPSEHPEGFPYVYTTAKGLHDVSPEELPHLPEDFISQVDKLFGVAKTDKKSLLDVSLEDLQDALQYVSPEEYDTWLAVGMALRSHLPYEVGFELWDSWASTSGKYNPSIMVAKWKSFKREGVGIGTLIYHAIQGGWASTISTEALTKDVLGSFITLDQVEDDIDTWDRSSSDVGVPSGMATLDAMLRYRRKEFTIISGYGNAGKSELLDSIAMGLARHQDWKFAVCSMEKSPQRHYRSLISKYAKTSFVKDNVDTYREAKSFIRKHFVMLDHDSVRNDFDSIIIQLERYLAVSPLDAVIIDPFNYISSPQQSSNPLVHTRHILVTLAALAKKHNIHVFLVAHPTKPDKTFGKLPRLTKYSIAGSADFVNIADNIVLVTRGKGNVAIVEVAKVRDQEHDRLGETALEFIKETGEYMPVDGYLEGEY